SAGLQNGSCSSFARPRRRHVSGDGPSMQVIQAADRHIRVHISAVLVEDSALSVVAVADSDAIGGSDLPAVEIVAAAPEAIEHDTASIIRTSVLDKLAGRVIPHPESGVNAQGTVGEVVGTARRVANP